MYLVRLRRRSWTAVGLAIALLAGVLASGVSSPIAAQEDEELLPIVFVHGLAGSAQQYQTQAMRFDSNGYPDDRIRAFEYNSGSILVIIGIPFGGQNTPLTNFIDGVRDEFGVDRVHLVGHSLGTGVANAYLGGIGAAARADRIATYTGIDGSNNATCGSTAATEHMECMGVWAGETGNVGGNNVFLPDQTHVEVATSPESFAAQYELMTGQPPVTTDVLPEAPGQVQISGRAVNFPANSGVEGATLEVWEIDSQTGARKFDEPDAVFDIGADGNWGPVAVNGLQHYELALQSPDADLVGHFYQPPFIRSSSLVRVLSASDDILDNTNVGDDHAAVVVLRQREWWMSHPSGSNDVLEIGTTSASHDDQPPVNVFQNATGNNNLGIHIHDAAATPGETTLNLLPFFPSQPFQTGFDVFMPAADPPDGVISFVNAPRGDTDRLQVINTPNWSSSTDRIAVFFNDYVQDINSFRDCMREHPQLCRPVR